MTKIGLKNRLRFWLYFTVVILLYGSFFTYVCVAKQNGPNNVEIQQQGDAPTIEAFERHAENLDSPTTGPRRSVGYDSYLSEITSFYERVITVLSIIIFVILGLNFLYIHRSSKDQAREMAIDALEAKPFEIVLQSMIAKSVDQYLQGDEFVQTCSEIPALQKRIEFLEQMVNVQAYELSDEGSGKVNNGNN
jgi:hypothetical protein